MTKEKQAEYESVQSLKEAMQHLNGRKFRLDCGHHVTFNHNLANNIIIHNGKDLTIICTECGY